jgi:serine/threonine-protein kinase RsbT
MGSLPVGNYIANVVEFPVITRIRICTDVDFMKACREGRELAAQVGFTTSDLTVIAVAISELGRNIVHYAKRGEIIMRAVQHNGTRGIMIVAKDDGPGIPDIERALEEGFSTSGSLGLGLPGVRRLMDEFEIISEPGRGTTVSVKKWRR